MQSYIKLLKRHDALVLFINFSLLVSSQAIPIHNISTMDDEMSPRKSYSDGNKNDSEVLIETPKLLENIYDNYNIKEDTSEDSSDPRMDTNIGFLRVTHGKSVGHICNKKENDLVHVESIIKLLQRVRDEPKSFYGGQLHNDNKDIIIEEHNEQSLSNQETVKKEPIVEGKKHRKQKKQRKEKKHKKSYHRFRREGHQGKKGRSISKSKSSRKAHKIRNKAKTKSTNLEEVKKLHNEEKKKLDKKSLKDDMVFDCFYGTTSAPLDSENHVRKPVRNGTWAFKKTKRLTRKSRRSCDG